MKFLHTRIRVSSLENSAAFYEKLGFTIGRKNDKSPAGNQIWFMEIPGEAYALELTYSPEYKVAVPEDLMHIALGVSDIFSYCAELVVEKGWGVYHPFHLDDRIPGMVMVFAPRNDQDLKTVVDIIAASFNFASQE